MPAIPSCNIKMGMSNCRFQVYRKLIIGQSKPVILKTAVGHTHFDVTARNGGNF
jgi:hypothetical protein